MNNYERNKKTLESIAHLLCEGKRFFLATHLNPDGDALGSMFALALVLRDQGKEVWCYLEEEIPTIYQWLPGQELVRKGYPEDDAWIGVVLDCAEVKRVGRAAEFLGRLREVIVLDHHEVTGTLGTLRLIEPIYATGGLVFYLLNRLCWPITKEIAENLYTAIFSDTGGFRFSQTTAETFEVAQVLVKAGAEPAKIAELLYERYPFSRFCLLRLVLDRLELVAGGKGSISFLRHEDFTECQASKAELDDFANFLRSIDGVEISALVKEYRPEEISVSLRSRGKINVARLALEFGGGGHACAAGFKLRGELSQVLSLVRERLEALFS